MLAHRAHPLGVQEARAVSTKQLLAEDDVVYAWRERMLDAFGGMARSFPACQKYRQSQ